MPSIESLVMLVLGALIAFMATWFWRYRSSVEHIRQKDDDLIRKLVADMALMQMQISPFWAAVQSKIADDLHHPSPQFAEMDSLLVKLSALVITPVERDRLEYLL